MKSKIKKISLILVILSVLLGIFATSKAVTVTTPVDVEKFFDTASKMPANNTSGGSGMFPQYFKSPRTVTLDDSRLNWSTNKWQATMNGSVVYCADYGGYVRYGKYDVGNVHWLMPEGTNIQSTTIPTTGQSVESQAEHIYAILRQAFYNMSKNDHYYDWISSDGTNAREAESSTRFTSELIYAIPGPKEAVGYLIADEYGYSQVEQIAKMSSESTSNMQSFLNTLGHHIWPSKYSSSIDDENYTNPGISATDGPEIVVMEQSSGGDPGYAESGGSSYSNNAKAFIFSASEDAYGTKEYAKEYSLNDIQGAYWLSLVDEPETGEAVKSPTTHLTANATTLYEKAKQYASFGGNFSASINSSEAQVIANRDTKEYIVGPYSISYTDIEDISYMKSLSINDNENLLYDEKHNGIEIILDGGKGSGTMVPGSNGLEKEFPRTGQKFFIKFSAEKAGYPTSVTLDARFEYISKTNATVETKLTAQANIYRYYGYCLISTNAKYAAATGQIIMRFTWPVGYSEPFFDWDGTSYRWEQHGDDEPIRVPDGEWKTRYWNDDNENPKSYDVYMPYVMMDEEYRTGDAQELTVIGDASREYTVVKKSITIDLSMELGGYVWEDGQAGKESVYNGIEDGGEKRIPNVIVTLSDGQTTKTDSNGEYKFTGLNAMYQYSVTFTYNGQYYQPTTFSGSSIWGTSEWTTNSNAKDSQDERKEFNLKFASIGSSPENYVGSAGANRTYTKQELLDAGVIDEFGNLIGGDGSMAQYVKDCMMKAYTFDLYPYPSLFVIDNKPVTREYVAAFHNQPAQLYDDAYYINLGLVHREQSDLAIKKDVDHVTLEINGQTHTYTYDTLENKENAENEWDISVRLSDAYYDAAYTRELYKSDYLYKVSNYGENFADYGKSKSDELEVYITYKIMVRNQAMSIRAKVDELVDYYDEDLEYVNERSYIQIKRGDNTGIYDVKASDKTRYSTNTTTDIAGYDNLYITGLDDKYLTAGQTAYVYLTFKVKKDTMNNEDWVRLDEEIVSGNAIGVGKENIVEVNGYSTIYAPGTIVPNVGDVSLQPAGIVDRDSNSGNLADTGIQKDNTNKGVFEKFEDDTDKAPNIRIILYRDDDTTRVISGSVWEDVRNETIGLTTTGDGIRDDKDTKLINGVTVQLVELMENGTEYVWREFGAPAATEGQEIGGTNTIGKGTGSGTVSSETPIINAFNLVKNYDFEEKHDGAYAFKSFMPGKYVVRFIYGDTVRTVTPASLNVGGLNEKSYNGQDYKSTTYQEGITQNKTYTWREKSTWSLGQETLGKVLTEVTTFKADASNNETANAKIDAQNQKGYLYDITASDAKANVSDAKDIESRRNEVVDYSDNDVTNYIAEVLASHKSDYTTMNDRTQLLNDLMNNTKMTAETGLIVIEFEYDREGTQDQTKDNKSSYKIKNVDLGLEERPKAQLAIDKEVTNVKLTLADGSILFDAKNTASNVLWRDHKAYSVGYKGNFMDEEKFGSIQNIRSKNASKFGLIQLSMDEELMHGATIEITYQVSVSNVGEVDYKDNLFYYTGNKSANAKIVTTKANQVIDYVANNLQFNVSNNKDWKVIEKDEIKSQGLVNAKLDSKVEKFNTIIVTESLSKDLVPELADKNNSSVSVPLVLTQLITSENDSDDLTYRNLVEIVKTSNTVGRRMEYSVVGNQDPESKPQELDSDIAEVVRILPPFGNAGRYIIITIIALTTLIIIIGGIIFIKKKVLKK